LKQCSVQKRWLFTITTPRARWVKILKEIIFDAGGAIYLSANNVPGWMRWVGEVENSAGYDPLVELLPLLF